MRIKISMKLKRFFHFYLVCFTILGLSSCNTDDEAPINPISGTDDDPPVMIDDDPGPTTVSGEAGSVKIFNAALMEDHFVLVNDAGNNRAFLMDKNAAIVHEWPLTNRLGNDAFLLSDGRLLASLEADEPKITLGGQGGKLQFVEKDGTVLWNFDFSSEEQETHHDAELLPNGNVLAMVWEKRTATEAADAGSTAGMDVFLDAVIEVNPMTDEIVWEWHTWDHLVQDVDNTKTNFGIVAENPQRININYVTNDNGDLTHGNGISYDPEKDVIYLSINFYHEVWVIDHSTTTAEAATTTGGNFGKGGDLLYRFGNPKAYDNQEGQRLFYNNHFPNILDGTNQGRMLIFGNGNDREQSTVYELELPNQFSLLPATDNEPTVVWSFTDPDLYSGRISGAVRLPNGNTMIAEGDFGIWEVTPQKEVVWKFSGDGFYWRAYHYAKDAPEIKSLGL